MHSEGFVPDEFGSDLGPPFATTVPRANVDNLQAGIEKSGADLGVSVTQVYVVVTIGSGSTYAYGKVNELTYALGSEAAWFSYKPNGELWTKTQGSVIASYTYNDMGLLTQVSGPTSATYAYDGLGRRVKATESGVTTYSVYGLGIDPVWEKTGSAETRHVYANGMRIARMIVGGPTYYYHTDALGST